MSAKDNQVTFYATKEVHLALKNRPKNEKLTGYINKLLEFAIKNYKEGENTGLKPLFDK